jgi:coenzyme F420-reducing hydrogenase delta subunit
VAYAKQLLDEIGLDGRRLEMYHIGASDAPTWAKAVREMTERARELGPNPIRMKRAGIRPEPAPGSGTGEIPAAV